MIRPTLIPQILAALLISTSTFLLADDQAGDNEAQSASAEKQRLEYELMLEQAESKRMAAHEAAQAAREAQAEMSRLRTEAAREQQELNQQQREELTKQRAMEVEEANRLRAQLSKTHRELREVSREVARAHRELSMIEDQNHVIRRVNLGDRAVIGVILGPETPEGVKIIGVSPDGPAERAGLRQDDIISSIRGVDLSDQSPVSGRQALTGVMNDVSAGEELPINVKRNGQDLQLQVTAEQREPRAWQSLIRIPESGELEPSPESTKIIVKHIEVPEIDEVAMVAEIAEMEARVKEMEYRFIIDGDDHDHPGGWEIDLQDMSEFGAHAMREANIWFGLPQAAGLQLSAINPELGEYFKTERGVLVIEAREDNAYTLQSGDVVLQISTTAVDTPADMLRALRALDSGSEVEIEIKRKRKNVTLKVIVPENRLSFNFSTRMGRP